MTWTKEQLKSLAGASSETRAPSSLPYLADNSTTEVLGQKKRAFTSRAVPKSIFAVLILAPAFAVAYFFANGLNPPAKSTANVSESEGSEEAQQLREQLAQAQAQLDETQAKLAAVRQEKPRTVPNVRKPAPVSSSKKSSHPPRRYNPAPIAVRSYSPPPRIVPLPKPIRPLAPVSRSRFSSLDRKIELPTEASVYGAGSVSVENVPTTSSSGELDLKTDEVVYAADFEAQNPTRSSGRWQREAVEAQALESDSDLEAPLLEEQTMLEVEAGTSAKVELSVPFVSAVSSRERELEERWSGSVTLAEPLQSTDGTIALPKGTKILVATDGTATAEIVEFVAVAADIPQPDGTTQRVPLPEGAIRFFDPDGEPVVAESLSEDAEYEEGAIESMAGDFGRSLSTSSIDDLGSSAARAAIGSLASEIFGSERSSRRSRRTALYLRAGTELTLFVESNFAVPVPSLSQSEVESENLVALEIYSSDEEDVLDGDRLFVTNEHSIDPNSLRFKEVYRSFP